LKRGEHGLEGVGPLHGRGGQVALALLGGVVQRRQCLLARRRRLWVGVECESVTVSSAELM
jgi:hypothetical protein